MTDKLVSMSNSKLYNSSNKKLMSNELPPRIKFDEVEKYCFKENGQPVKAIPGPLKEKIWCQIIKGLFPAEVFHENSEFPRFIFYRPDYISGCIIYKISENTRELVPVSSSTVADYLHKFSLKFVGPGIRLFQLTHRQSLAIVESWLAQEAHLKILPRSVGFKDELGFCLHRLDFKPDCSIDSGNKMILKAKIPFFYGFISRMTQADSFCARIGSLFDYEADRKQAVWLRGEKDGGKSQLAWFIKELMGPGFTELSNEMLTSRFWKATLIGKRAAVISEANSDFVKNSSFLNLLGESSHLIERKGKDGFMSDLDTMIFFLSNEYPNIPDKDQYLSRIILCNLHALDPNQMLPEKTVRENLIRERELIVGHCINCWEKAKNENRGRIWNNLEELEFKVFEKYMEEYNWVQGNLIEDSDSYLIDEELRTLINNSFPGFQNRQNKVRHVLEKLGAMKKRKSFRSSKRIVWDGWRVRTSEEKLLRKIKEV